MNTAESYQEHRNAGATHAEAIALVREEQQKRADKVKDCVSRENDVKRAGR